MNYGQIQSIVTVTTSKMIISINSQKCSNHFISQQLNLTCQALHLFQLPRQVQSCYDAVAVMKPHFPTSLFFLSHKDKKNAA